MSRSREKTFGRMLTAMVTPMNESGGVDYDCAGRLARHLADEGSDGIVVAGTTGEGPTLSDEEMDALLRTVIEAVDDPVRVVASTGTYDTAESIRRTQHAASIGCHGILAVTPYYSRPPQRALVSHFRVLADASDLPVIIYNIPSRTGRLVEVDTLRALAEHPRIVATKDSVGDIMFTARCRNAVPDDFAIYSGDDAMILPMISVGGTGAISVTAHVAGPEIRRMIDAAHSGDCRKATRLHLQLMPVFDAVMTLETNPIGIKGAMEALWGRVGQPRSPLVRANETTILAIEKALKQLHRD